MKKKTILLFWSLLAIAAGLAFTSSCSTTEGFGQDLQDLGQEIESEAVEQSY